MSKKELIEAMAQEAGISKAAAGKALSAMTSAVAGSLAKGKKVTLVGFGTWKVSDRKARKGRNPKTGKEMKIPASKLPVFKAGSKLKAALKKKK